VPKFVAGERYPLLAYDVIYDGSYEGAKSIAETVKPGLVYEFVFWVRPGIRDVGNMYEFLKELERKLPGIGINYIEVSDDGRVVRVQMFDPPELKYVAIIVVAIALVLVSYFGYLAIERITALGEKIVYMFPPVPPEFAPYFWGVIIFAIGCVAVYLVIRALRSL
jgi:hypothetical protein